MIIIICLEYTGFRNEFGSTFVKSEDEFNFDEHHGWKLTLDEKCNANIRDEYLYEQVGFVSRE